jgi:hypothetical protein
MKTRMLVPAIALLCLSSLSTGAWALTPAQLATLKSAITADSALQAFAQGPDGAWAMADYLNQEKAPAVVVWKTSVNPEEIMKNGMDWTQVDNLSVGKARIWDWLTRLGTFDASKVNVRAGIDACWVGTAQALAVRAQVYTHCKRNATRAEALYAVGAGTDASPSVMGWEGLLVYTDVEAARRLP